MSSSESIFYPERNEYPALDALWDKPVRELAQLHQPLFSPPEKERHALYSQLVLALLAAFWNGNKHGPDGEYPWRERQRLSNGQGYEGGDYLGHNIACIAVDERGRVVDFDFNHNQIFDSTVEHAESRLVRRIFSLVHLHDGWMWSEPSAAGPVRRSATNLSNITVYTSLEPCSQCAGIMTLGHVKEVVFLQPDQGQYSIASILLNLARHHGTKYLPARPVPARAFGLDYFDKQRANYVNFARTVAERPFFVSPDHQYTDRSSSIASFLCTDSARDAIATGAAPLLASAALSFPDFHPTSSEHLSGVLSNQEIAQHCLRFLDYAIRFGRRGTPHQL